MQFQKDGAPRGCGVVQFDSIHSAETAISKLNGYVYGGRILEVRYDRPPKSFV
jgi:RNA recognition motif-containing protein